jgi:hypothetical protein
MCSHRTGLGFGQHVWPRTMHAEVERTERHLLPEVVAEVMEALSE